ncbi:MAG TPA: hypothetical protein VFR24_26155 [Candidatus Angelobacter sp.]|nr:hypothetical protein [Candidatus Angelobacter sp.]
MSLDTEKLHRLHGKGFPEFYKKHPNKWKEMVDKARDYAQTCVGANEKVRVGDVVTIVQNAIKIDPEFETFVKGKSLTQKYWVAWFAEYLIDQVYPQPDLKSDGNTQNQPPKG